MPLETLNMLQFNGQSGLRNALQLSGEPGSQIPTVDERQLGKPPLPHQKIQTTGIDPVVSNPVTAANSTKTGDAVQR